MPSHSQVTAPTETAGSSQDGERQEQPERGPAEAPTPDLRERLLALPRILSNRIPNQRQIDRLKSFLQDNQPCDPQQVS